MKESLRKSKIMASINEFSDEARYHIKAVMQKTDIQAVTIRAWERRYSLLEPKRANNGYRLYSDRDIALLIWVKSQVDSGLSISSVVVSLKEEINQGNWPDALLTTQGPVPIQPRSGQDVAKLKVQFLTALLRLDEHMAVEIFSEILGQVNLADLVETVVIPVLVEIGDRWERGEISVAIEHFASNLIQGKIQAIYQSLPYHLSAPKVLVGCGPDELHALSPLLFATLLRDSGYRVEFLGPDIPLEDLLEYIIEEKPKMVIISAMMGDSIPQLVDFSRRLAQLKTAPLLGFGGAAFNRNPESCLSIQGIYLGKTMSESLARVKELLPVKVLSHLN
jgi:methanogenic corrinoid protein MtbC1